MHRIVLSALPLVAVLFGCGYEPIEPAPSRPYRTVAEDPRRNIDLARAENARAVDLVGQENFDAAENALKAALEADVFYGPAHNNLGMVYFRKQQYYLAAWEFQYAAKLMPNKAEPRNNLGLVMENAGRMEEAMGHYDQALALEPDNPNILGNLARARLRANRRDGRTRQLLQELVLKDDRPRWTEWARRTLAEMGEVPPPTGDQQVESAPYAPAQLLAPATQPDQ